MQLNTVDFGYMGLEYKGLSLMYMGRFFRSFCPKCKMYVISLSYKRIIDPVPSGPEVYCTVEWTTWYQHKNARLGYKHLLVVVVVFTHSRQGKDSLTGVGGRVGECSWRKNRSLIESCIDLVLAIWAYGLHRGGGLSCNPPTYCGQISAIDHYIYWALITRTPV